jgi:LCP family protein required for cell wall assembly
MENNSNEMTRRGRKKNQKKKKRGRGCLWFFLILLLALGGILLYGYFEIRQTTDTIHSEVDEDFIQHTSREDNQIELSNETPFSILLMGVDAREADRGRSDTMMVMTVNPNTDKTTLVSIPRDTYTEIIGRGFDDKINHAYAFGGPTMSMNTVQNFLDIPIDYYVSVNMEGIQQIVDAIGGITLTPSRSFSQSGFTFVEGQPTQMNGEMALAYSRMRSEDGDYARQGRQREVVLATLDKIASFNTILNFQSVLQTMEDNVSTNLVFNEMVNIFLNYQDALGNIEEIQMNGSGTMIGGVYYEIIPEEEVNRVSQQLQEELEISE